MCDVHIQHMITCHSVYSVSELFAIKRVYVSNIARSFISGHQQTSYTPITSCTPSFVGTWPDLFRRFKKGFPDLICLDSLKTPWIRHQPWVMVYPMNKMANHLEQTRWLRESSYGKPKPNSAPLRLVAGCQQHQSGLTKLRGKDMSSESQTQNGQTTKHNNPRIPICCLYIVVESCYILGLLKTPGSIVRKENKQTTKKNGCLLFAVVLLLLRLIWLLFVVLSWICLRSENDGV